MAESRSEHDAISTDPKFEHAADRSRDNQNSLVARQAVLPVELMDCAYARCVFHWRAPP